MVKSYCVKEKIQTECLPNTEKYFKMGNRYMMQCKCITPAPKCGITKTKFISKDDVPKNANITIKSTTKKRTTKKGN